MQGKKILVIEDMGLQRHIYGIDLKKVGFDVISTDTGENGIALAQKEKPDLIICDIMLPGIDGIETVKRLKSDNSTKNIPVIMNSAKSQRKDIIDAIQAGASYYSVKPTKFEIIHKKIIELIS